MTDAPPRTAAASAVKTAPAPALKMYDVSVRDHDVVTVTAHSPAAARYDVWRGFSEPYPNMTFRRFLDMVRVRRRHAAPCPDGYQEVRRQYGVDPTIGWPVLVRAGTWRAREAHGVVVYPGPSTVHIHVAVPGCKRPLIVHPSDVELLAPDA